MRQTNLLYTFVFTTITFFAQGQNYLFEKDKSGFSGGIGLLTEQFESVDAYALHLEYTILGRFTLGYNRAIISGGDGSNNFNASYCIVKKQNNKSGLNIPIIIGITGSEQTVYSYGLGLSFMNQTSESVKVAPTFSIVRSVLPSSYYSFNNSFTAIGFELNIISNKLRITPNVTFSQQIVFFGLDGGFLFQH